MVRVCKVEIRNFRSIRLLTWQPSPGLNCLIGPGDSGKTTILDAIDLCLGARRNVSFSDTDFFGLDVSQPISITLTTSINRLAYLNGTLLVSDQPPKARSCSIAGSSTPFILARIP